MENVIQVGIPVTVNAPSNESKGVEGKTSAPETPVKEEKQATVRRTRRK